MAVLSAAVFNIMLLDGQYTKQTGKKLTMYSIIDIFKCKKTPTIKVIQLCSSNEV